MTDSTHQERMQAHFDAVVALAGARKAFETGERRLHDEILNLQLAVGDAQENVRSATSALYADAEITPTYQGSAWQAKPKQRTA